jgi:methylthioribose-1-phosphate isomerase
LLRRGLAVLIVGSTGDASLAQVGTAFTYQGRLTEGGTPANGSYDLQLKLWDAANGGGQVGSSITLGSVSVASGRFTVAVDFGPGAFAGSRRWLEIGVAPGGSDGPFTTLAPRQELTPVANAIYASNAATVAGLACADGQVAKWSASAWTCGDVVGNAGGTVTSVGSGAGLTGGPITGVGTLSIATGGVTSSMIANGAVGTAQIDASQIQARLAAVCPVGQFLRGVNADGSIVCDSVYVPPTITNVDDPPANNVGQFTSIAIGQDGFPVISYYDLTAAALKVAKCVNAACTGTSTITNVDDPVNSVGGYTSIAIGQDGFPVISYRDATAAALKVAKCVNAACTGTSTITNVDPANAVGAYTSIASGQDGFPVISYRDATAAALKVAKCANAACTGTSTLTTVDDLADLVGDYTSIAIGQDGFPVISYQNQTAATLKVAKCVNAACTGTSTITTVDDAADAVGYYTSIAIGQDGFPVISYYDNTALSLKVAKCVNASCTGASTITTVDDPANSVGAYTSIAIGQDGFPVISYHDATAGTLKVAKCVNAACTGTSTITTVDDPANTVGSYTSIAIGQDGFPVISYLDATAAALKVAKCSKSTCAP